MIFTIPSKSVYQYLVSELLSFIQTAAPIPAHIIFILDCSQFTCALWRMGETQTNTGNT